MMIACVVLLYFYLIGMMSVRKTRYKLHTQELLTHPIIYQGLSKRRLCKEYIITKVRVITLLEPAIQSKIQYVVSGKLKK